MPGNRCQKSSCSPFSVSKWIGAVPVERRNHIERIGSRCIDDQVVTGYPLVELANGFRVARNIAYRQPGQVDRRCLAAPARGDFVLSVQQSADDRIADVAGSTNDERSGGGPPTHSL